MLGNTRVQMAALLAVGALLGYLAASAPLPRFGGADAAPVASGKQVESGCGTRAAGPRSTSRSR